MRPSVLLSSLLIAATTAASIFSLPIGHSLSHPHIYSSSHLSRRQSVNSNSSNSRPNTTTITAAQQESAILTSCTSALSLLAGKPESPSGMSLCYNILTLNNSTGVFKADLRLFKVGDPRDGWSNISMADVKPSVRWRGAGASVMNSRAASNLTTRDTGARLARRADNDGSGPQLMESYAFIGQLNAEFLNRTMNSSNLQALLLPIVTLTATTATNTSTTLTTSEASFLISLFSSTPLTATPFVLPGVTLEIFPIGAIITGSWTLLFVSTIGWGAFKKMQFREHYRRRVRRDEVMGRSRGRI